MKWLKAPLPPPAVGSDEAQALGCTCERRVRTGGGTRFPGLGNQVITVPNEVIQKIADPHCPLHGPVARQLREVMDSQRAIFIALVGLTAALWIGIGFWFAHIAKGWLI
jgi:hypothetical protein